MVALSIPNESHNCQSGTGLPLQGKRGSIPNTIPRKGFLETEKYDAKPTYKKFLGYRPGVYVIGDMIVYVEGRAVSVLSASVPSASHPVCFAPRLLRFRPFRSHPLWSRRFGPVGFAPLVEGVGDAVGNVLQGACFRRFRLFGAGGSICSPPRASWRCARYGVRLRTRRRNRRRAS